MAWNGEVGWPDVGPTPLQPFLAPLTNLPAGTAPVSAGLGEANMVGGLSVPSGWTVAAPEIRSIAMISPLTQRRPRCGGAVGGQLGKRVQPDGAGGYGGPSHGRPTGC